MTSLRGFLQDYPAPLVAAWRVMEWALARFRPLVERLGLERASRWLHWAETPFKRLTFDCQDCGQCVLHYTGMTCPMTCPKQLRNGPCGGVRLDGTCEVYSDRDCVWVKAWERAERTPYVAERLRINPPVDWQLEGTSSWVTHAVGRDQVATSGEQAPRYATAVLPEGELSWPQ